MKKYNLLVMAHPDDESIFCGGLLQVYRRRPWKVICVTDGNADGEGTKRRKDFLSACDFLRVEGEMWDFPDRFHSRLDVSSLQKRLEDFTPVEVFTHGALGEYGHPHHQDVCLAAYRAFYNKATLWSVAYNCFPDKVFRLPRKVFDRKCEVLVKNYFSETKDFQRWLAAQPFEGYAKLDLKEVEALYDYFNSGARLNEAALKKYAWYKPYLEQFRRDVQQRPF